MLTFLHTPPPAEMGNSPGKEAVPAPQPPQPPAKQARVEPGQLTEEEQNIEKVKKMHGLQRLKKALEVCVWRFAAPRAHKA